MSRRRRADKRQVQPDPKYGRIDITKFINRIMKQGKRSVAETIVYDALLEVEKKTKGEAIKFYLDAIENIRPSMELKTRRVGGANYQVPVDVRTDRSIDLAQRWLISGAQQRSEKTMFQRLAAEIIDATQSRGWAVKKREETHKMAEANRAFSHLKWGN